ncbi:hypothetical protein BE17_29305 [Sorangium cellulosum]|uniref:Uncharacterized protein n=1 Tax=Sorangium cellulosum TaxID=56 RepID=A0A150RQD2_SORCE|nr:hypothetical protein BE17_29305 [Sorangium cellulosum]
MAARTGSGDRSRGCGGGGSFARGLLAASSGDGTTGGGTSSARGGSVGGVELCVGDDAGRAALSRSVTGSPTWITTVFSASVWWSSCSCQRRFQYRAGVPVKASNCRARPGVIGKSLLSNRSTSLGSNPVLSASFLLHEGIVAQNASRTLPGQGTGRAQASVSSASAAST